MTDTARLPLVLVAAALVPASCYATYERGQTAANARDWPTAEAELLRYQQGADCIGRVPVLSCKQAAVRLGEVLIEDGRPTSAGAVFRFAQRQYFKKAFGTPDVDRDLDDRIVNGLRTAKQLWDRFRSGVSGQCQVVTRYQAPSQFRLETLRTELDMERMEPSSSPTDSTLLFDKASSAGPHEIIVFATYVDPSTPGFKFLDETRYYRSCENGERLEIVFQSQGTDASHLKVDITASGGKPVPLEGPLRPSPSIGGL